jgi:hypothetical protein
MCKDERPRLGTGGAVEPRQGYSTPPLPAHQDPEATASIPIRDKGRWSPRDLEAVVGMSWRWMLREIAAGRMPPPDLRLGRSAGYRPATIMSWLDELAGRQGRSSRP